jgi:phosphatidylserine decarboxylase
MEMLRLFDEIIATAPDFEDNDLVGFPINAILDWPMGTTAGMSAFSRENLDAQFKSMFDVWSTFLTSLDSRYVLTNADNGWFGAAATAAMPNFTETYVCNPTVMYYGYDSWDDFFTRFFQDGVRPVMYADNNLIINSACESAVYKISYNISALDTFWIKSEPYSLNHMLNGDPLTPQFVGGTVYQAFLSALKYHRWHSPVNGTITKIVNIPGTYYLESPSHGFASESGPDPAAPNLSQGFITCTAARALIFIQAANDAVGLMCFVAVGMAEVSTCEVTVKEGDAVKKGDQLGMFHFGGSTHCLIFRPQTKITFDPQYGEGMDVPLNVGIASIG